MLELIFQGFAEWLYGLILECWEHFSSSLLDIMSMDFAYLQEQIPILSVIRQILLAAGWALLLGNLVFQAARTMMTGIGFEGEDPKLLFTRTFVFSFLLLASPQICQICLDLTSTVMELLDTPDVAEISLLSESAFDGLDAAWLLVILCGIIVIVQSFKLILELAERYLILAMLTICAPLAFGVGGSRSTADIFQGWCRMYGSMCFLMVSHVIFLNLLLSVLAAAPSGLSVLPWMVLILSIVKVAKKSDAIITRIGLNPAITSDSLGRGFPGALTYMVLRNVSSHVTKAAASSVAGQGPGRSGGTAPGGCPVPPRDNGPSGGSSGAVLNSHTSASQTQSQVRSASAQQSGQTTQSSTQTYAAATQQTSNRTQANTQAYTTATQQSNQSMCANAQAASQSQTSHTQTNRTTPTAGGGVAAPFQTTPSRNSAVPPGVRRSPSHVPSPHSAGAARTPASVVQHGDVVSNGPVVQPPQGSSTAAPSSAAFAPGHPVSPPTPGNSRETRSSRYTASHTAAHREQVSSMTTAIHGAGTASSPSSAVFAAPPAGSAVSGRVNTPVSPHTSASPTQETRFTHHHTEHSVAPPQEPGAAAPSMASVPGMAPPPSRRTQADPKAGHHSVLSTAEPAQVQPSGPAVSHTASPPVAGQAPRASTRQTARQERLSRAASPQSSPQSPVKPSFASHSGKPAGDTFRQPPTAQNRPPRPAAVPDTAKPWKEQPAKQPTRQTSNKPNRAPGGDRHGR